MLAFIAHSIEHAHRALMRDTLYRLLVPDLPLHIPQVVRVCMWGRMVSVRVLQQPRHCDRPASRCTACSVDFTAILV